jgi:hypothetical protein
VAVPLVVTVAVAVLEAVSVGGIAVPLGSVGICAMVGISEGVADGGRVGATSVNGVALGASVSVACGVNVASSVSVGTGVQLGGRVGAT